MRNFILMSLVIFASLSLSSCCNDNKCVSDGAEEIYEGRISTHTTKSHSVHQDITPEERELAKEHISNETAPGVSVTSIDAEGAKMINEARRATED